MSDVNLVREGRTILTNVNLCVHKGDFIAVTGPNGGGKTSLMRLILGLIKPTDGSICYFNESGEMLRRLLRPGYLPQKNAVDSHFPISVREVVASALINHKMTDAQRDKDVARVLDLMGLGEYSERSIGRLSGGQLQRTLFARAIVCRPDVLVLDEPLSYLDARYEQQLCSVVEELSHNSTVLLVSHQMTRIAALANRHIIVERSVRECSHAHHYAAPEC
ncbi:MAG: ATP-binding cassette domain-containing protein [Muribaculaceae bacterium]|nr:ATP-binding cassette domain-containing protein [Muribaculaceae bacterium]